MQGAGGTGGGVGKFFMGLLMMCGGFYMLFNAVMVQSNFGFGYGMYGFQAFGTGISITSGTIMIPFILGIAMVFYNVKSLLGWVITLGSLGALIFGVIASLHFNLRSMSLFELLVILILSFGGLALFFNSMRSQRNTVLY